MYDVTSSSDGSHIAVSAEYNNTLFTTTNGGATWASQPESTYWTSLASSADGMEIAAVSRAVAGSTGVVISTNGGATWTAYSVPGYHPYSNEQDWVDVTMSADGTALAVAERNGDVYTSTNGGATWTDRSSAGSRFWVGLASCFNGNTIAAVADNGINVSTDGGATWTAQAPSGGQWDYDESDIASSADGNKLVATDGFSIYTGTAVSPLPSCSPPPPTPPSCSVTFDQNPMTGQSTTMHWSSQNTTGGEFLYINNYGPATASG